METALTTSPENRPLQKNVSFFSSPENFDNGQRMAKLLVASDIVPTTYKGNISNCLIALDMANRMGVMPIVLMQNMDVIHGKPALSAKFLISRINEYPKFPKGIKFKYGVDGKVKLPEKSEMQALLMRGGQTVDNTTCYAYATDSDGNELKGTTISINMAIAEGWWTRKASKWHTMYEQMLSYRAASFFSRVHCPEVSLGGMLTTDEAQETIDTDYTESSSKPVKKSAIETLNETIAAAPDPQKMNIQDVDILPDNKEPFDEL
jgi:hypothetical protein